MAEDELENREEETKLKEDSGLEIPRMRGATGAEMSAVKSALELMNGDGGTGDGETFLCVECSIFRAERPRANTLPVSGPRSISDSVIIRQLLPARDWLAIAESV